MPSRTAMVLAGARGDPIFGALARIGARFLGPAIKGIGRLIRGQSKTALVLRSPGTGRLITTRASARGVARFRGRATRVARAVGAAAGLGAVFEAGGQLFDAVTGEPVDKKRKRMNVLNPRALSRATRRLAGFNRRSKSVEKQLRKLCPPSRRRFSAPHRPATHPSVDV